MHRAAGRRYNNSTMLAKLHSFTLLGIDALPVEVEVDLAGGMGKIVLVGLPELAVKESVHRIERALANLGYARPLGRLIISLAPADLRKEGGAFDLPIALGILVATGQIKPEQIKAFGTVGELALDGSVRPVHGALSIAMAARALGLKKMVVPRENAREAAVVTEVEVYGVTSLAEAVGIITGAVAVDPVSPGMDEIEARLNKYDVDFADVRGQESAKRAVMIAAAGSHNLLMLWTIPPFVRRYRSDRCELGFESFGRGDRRAQAHQSKEILAVPGTSGEVTSLA